jgi:hypothetical protein
MTKFDSKLVRPKSMDPDPAGSRNDLRGRILIIPDPHPDRISQDPQRVIHNSALDFLTFIAYYFDSKFVKYGVNYIIKYFR